MTALARLDLRLTPRSATVEDTRGAASTPFDLAQARALRPRGEAIRPEHVDLVRTSPDSVFAEAAPHADDLRLPPPPEVSPSGPALQRATLRAVDRYRSSAPPPPGADPAALQAEGRMMALLDGIDRLKLEIADRARNAPTV